MKKVYKMEKYDVSSLAFEELFGGRSEVASEVIKEYSSSSSAQNDVSYNDLKDRKNKEAKFSFSSITILETFEDKYKTITRNLSVNISIHIDKEITPSMCWGRVIITQGELSSASELFENYADTMLSGIITITDNGIELFNPGDEETNAFDKAPNVENLTKEFGLYRKTERRLSNDFYNYSGYDNCNIKNIIYVAERVQFFAKIYNDYYYSVSYDEDLNGRQLSNEYGK